MTFLSLFIFGPFWRSQGLSNPISSIARKHVGKAGSFSGETGNVYFFTWSEAQKSGPGSSEWAFWFFFGEPKGYLLGRSWGFRILRKKHPNLFKTQLDAQVSRKLDSSLVGGSQIISGVSTWTKLHSRYHCVGIEPCSAPAFCSPCPPKMQLFHPLVSMASVSWT